MSEDIDEIPVNIPSENNLDDKVKREELEKLLEIEKTKSLEYEEKLKLALADYTNLARKTQSDIENGINLKLNEFASDFLKIYDDFLRARDVFASTVDTQGSRFNLEEYGFFAKKIRYCTNCCIR